MSTFNRISAGTIIVLSVVTFVFCGGAAADKVFNYEPPDVENLDQFGTWATSGELSFKITRVENTDKLMIGEETVKADGSNRFLVVTLHVMPAQKGKGRVDYVSQAKLADRSGTAYRADPVRFWQFNSITGTVLQIKSGSYLTYKLPFLVPRNFEPVALRCLGVEEGAQPVHLALSRD